MNEAAALSRSSEDVQQRKARTAGSGNRSFITEQDVEQALDFLTNSARGAADARATRQHLEDYTRVIKAQLMMEHADQPLGAQEREAYADQRYIDHLKAVREAVAEDERRRFMREAMATRIEAWRTQCSNERAHKL